MNFAATKKICRSQSKVKQIMIFVHDKDGIIAADQVPNGVLLTAAYYQKFIFSVLRPQSSKLRPEKINGSVSTLHDNVHLRVTQPVID